MRFRLFSTLAAFRDKFSSVTSPDFQLNSLVVAKPAFSNEAYDVACVVGAWMRHLAANMRTRTYAIAGKHSNETVICGISIANNKESCNHSLPFSNACTQSLTSRSNPCMPSIPQTWKISCGPPPSGHSSALPSFSARRAFVMPRYAGSKHRAG